MPDRADNEPPRDPADNTFLAQVYDELRALAARRLASELPGQTLQATALVHEAWLKIAGGNPRSWHGKTHFYAAAAQAMRQILIDQARRKRAARHGGGWLRIDAPEFEAIASPGTDSPDATEELCIALDTFARTHPIHAQLVQLRFFTGLTLKQAGEILEISEPTAKRYWAFSRAWLFRELHRPSTPNPGT